MSMPKVARTTDRHRRDHPTHIDSLTPREIEVLRLADRTAKQIADVLFLSPNTVIAHLDNIRGKLGLASKPALAAWAARNGYL
jgi:DNA-binding CsgD family transcriptional regulator